MIGLIFDAIRITVVVVIGIMLLPILVFFPFALG